MRIQNNISSLNAWRNLTGTDNHMSKNLERLSSGYRINRAGDDVAGLAISENMRAQIKGLNQAVKNAQDGISLLQTAEGSLNEVHSILHRMRELSLQAANGTLQPEDRKQIQTEMDNLAKEITRTTNATQFNSKDLLDGSLRKAGSTGFNNGGVQDITLQIGPNDGQTVAFEIGAMDAASLGVARDVATAVVFKDNGGAYETGADIVDSVDATGAVNAGLVSGVYRVEYDDQAKTVQLFNEATGKAVGTAQSIMAEDGTTQLTKVTVGDKNTAEQITINLMTGLDGGGNQTDFLNVGAKVATVDAGATGINVTGQVGITEVGWGLKDGAYTVTIDATGSVQLSDAGGTIGSAKANALGEVIIGDEATGRYIKFDSTNTASTTFDFVVKNNGQSAEDAKFTGGVKYGSAQSYAGLNVSSADGAQAALKAIDGAIAKVSYQRSQLGAIQNRLEHTINNLEVVSENLTASESRIRDVDMAMEMASFTKQQILMQSGTAMLAQANQKNQAVLSLLR